MYVLIVLLLHKKKVNDHLCKEICGCSFYMKKKLNVFTKSHEGAKQKWQKKFVCKKVTRKSLQVLRHLGQALNNRSLANSNPC